MRREGEMMELKVGKVTMKDLSLWFGRNEKYMSNSSKTAKEKAFKKLENYADYHWEGKSLIIDKVKHPVFTKAFVKSCRTKISIFYIFFSFFY